MPSHPRPIILSIHRRWTLPAVVAALAFLAATLVPAARAATEGYNHNFFGTGAGANTEGGSNAFFGGNAGNANTSGFSNAFFGFRAGEDNTTGHANAFFGGNAGLSNTTGEDNAFVGRGAGQSNTIGSFNAFFGRSAGFQNIDGNFNAFFGRHAGFSNTQGSENAFFGHQAGRFNTTGCCNAFLGTSAGHFNSTGSNNVFLGRSAGASNTAENANTYIGAFSDGAAGITNATALGLRAKVTQSNSLVLGSIAGANGSFFNTDVGIGITAPAAPLHVRRFNSTAQVLVEDTGASSVQTMFSLINNGHPKFRLEDASQPDVRWEFRTAGSEGGDERFQVNKIGSGVIEFQLNAGGDAEFAGDVTANGVVLDSSREIKTDFSLVDEHTVLQKVAALDISQWRYTREPTTERHIGPMAEDFQAMFGLGDGKHISVGDANGILFAATKALKAENDALREKVVELDEIKARLADLESRVGDKD